MAARPASSASAADQPARLAAIRPAAAPASAPGTVTLRTTLSSSASTSEPSRAAMSPLDWVRARDGSVPASLANSVGRKSASAKSAARWLNRRSP